MNIERGTIVKAWITGDYEYVIGSYDEPDEIIGHYVDGQWWCNVVPVPIRIVEQLDKLK